MKLDLHDTGFLRLPDVLKLFPVKKSTWWAGVSRGAYPKPVKLSERVSAWRAEDIYALIQEKTEQISTDKK